MLCTANEESFEWKTFREFSINFMWFALNFMWATLHKNFEIKYCIQFWDLLLAEPSEEALGFHKRRYASIEIKEWSAYKTWMPTEIHHARIPFYPCFSHCWRTQRRSISDDYNIGLQIAGKKLPHRKYNDTQYNSDG